MNLIIVDIYYNTLMNYYITLSNISFLISCNIQISMYLCCVNISIPYFYFYDALYDLLNVCK